MTSKDLCSKCNGFGFIMYLEQGDPTIKDDGDNRTYTTNTKIHKEKCDKCDGLQRVKIYSRRSN